MVIQRLSENLINISIVPKRVRWPEPSSAAAWAKAHDCVFALQNLVRNVDLDCLQIEQRSFLRKLSARDARRSATKL
jgi:hypothetical protein